MKLIIQIPCLNEEEALPITFRDLPTELEGIDEIEVLIIDDGSTDRTVEVAHELGVHHIVRHTQRKGLAAAFQSGINASLRFGADIIVHTDADNQYPGVYIRDLIKPILDQKADFVIADRQTQTVEHFSPAKKFLQKLGTAAVRYVSNTDVPDAPSGFRAMSREVALRFNVLTNYTYTLETIIQAGTRNFAIAYVPIHINPKLRESRLFKNMPQYVIRSATNIIYMFVLYKPLRTFIYLTIPFITIGSFLWLRYLILLIQGDVERSSHVQSVIVGAVALMIGFFIFLIGLLSNLIMVNRQMHEESLYYLKQLSFSKPKENPPE